MPNFSDAKEYFQRGATPGAFVGGVLGLLPGILLILVLGGADYGVGLFEVLNFIVMSIVAGILVGGLVGGSVAFVVVAGQRAVNSLRSKS